ncbi:hypothetical protein OWR29_43890 [Actinoplanes sp. Pm04-4]|uniref:Uncharacterized protein n=1 Tax=Paractinoplanes pyxinae TaxID=2997416 RepID=A0ABT4BEM2_9ACTN|nr:hypothetical protein [Actinoplanes pyxinae]MCY1144983.1 hypothetical protein [Actinoplanes pyxinae]
MIVIQRVRVRWTAAGRGAPEADRRRDLNEPVPLPAGVPAEEVVLHDVLADEAACYQRDATVSGGGFELARDAGFGLARRGADLVIDRLPGWESYPRRPGKQRLFVLKPGEVGRYRTNFRWTACECDQHWSYDEWNVHIAHQTPFVTDGPDHEADHRVHLYGGRRRTAVSRAARGRSRPRPR